MKKLLVLIVILALAAGAGYAWKKGMIFQRVDAAEKQQEAAPTLKVSRGTIDLRVSTTGKVVSNLDVEIKSKASGQIIKLPYDISDKVSSGALLAELDPVDENRNVILTEAALTSAKARLAQAMESLKTAQIAVDTGTSDAMANLQSAQTRNRDSQSRLARGEDLFKKQLISKEELDTARTEAASAASALQQAQARMAETRTLPMTVEVRKQDVKLNEAEVKRAQINLDNALQRLKETKIFAPMDGVVVTRPVQTGQIIASGISNVGGGTSLMTLSDLSRLFVSASVDESDIGKIKESQSAMITADAYPGKRFRGKVVRIATKGENNSNVVTFEVKIEVTGEGRELLKPEMTTNIDIQAEHHENVLMLPNEAVQFGKEGYFVELPGSTAENKKRQKVKIGLTDGLNTEIVEGVAENQEVATPSSLQSKWAQGGAGQGQGQGQGQGASLDRGMRMATMRLSGAGRRH